MTTSETNHLYNEVVEDALKRLKHHESRVRGLVKNVTIDVEDLRLVLQEIDNLRSNVKKQIY
jgi:hypothetical protein